jgi:hypothetical protein
MTAETTAADPRTLGPVVACVVPGCFMVRGVPAAVADEPPRCVRWVCDRHGDPTDALLARWSA